MEITLRIILQSPPPGVNYALQKGSGSNFTIVQMQTSGSGNLLFELPVTLRPGDGVDFAGPFVQGPKGGRFIYISIGKRAHQPGSPWDRRLKVPLTGIDEAMVKNLANGKILETTVPGTDKKGEPTCATVKPFDGWTAANA